MEPPWWWFRIKIVAVKLGKINRSANRSVNVFVPFGNARATPAKLKIHQQYIFKYVLRTIILYQIILINIFVWQLMTFTWYCFTFLKLRIPTFVNIFRNAYVIVFKIRSLNRTASLMVLKWNFTKAAAFSS